MKYYANKEGKPVMVIVINTIGVSVEKFLTITSAIKTCCRQDRSSASSEQAAAVEED